MLNKILVIAEYIYLLKSVSGGEPKHSLATETFQKGHSFFSLFTDSNCILY